MFARVKKSGNNQYLQIVEVDLAGQTGKLVFITLDVAKNVIIDEADQAVQLHQ